MCGKKRHGGIAHKDLNHVYNREEWKKSVLAAKGPMDGL